MTNVPNFIMEPSWTFQMEMINIHALLSSLTDAAYFLREGLWILMSRPHSFFPVICQVYLMRNGQCLDLHVDQWPLNCSGAMATGQRPWVVPRYSPPEEESGWKTHAILWSLNGCVAGEYHCIVQTKDRGNVTSNHYTSTVKGKYSWFIVRHLISMSIIT